MKYIMMDEEYDNIEDLLDDYINIEKQRWVIRECIKWTFGDDCGLSADTASNIISLYFYNNDVRCFIEDTLKAMESFIERTNCSSVGNDTLGVIR